MSQYLAQITNPYLSDTFQGMYGFDFVNRIVPSLIVFGLVVGIIIFVFMLISGGVQWIASSGNKVALEDARRKITHALIGLFILLSLWAFIGLINLIFGVNIGNLDIIDREPTPGPVTIDCSNNEHFRVCECQCDSGWTATEGCDPTYPSCNDTCTCTHSDELPTETPPYAGWCYCDLYRLQLDYCDPSTPPFCTGEFSCECMASCEGCLWVHIDSNVCELAESDRYCGTGGATCQNCTESGMICIDHSCQPNTACVSPGDNCNNNNDCCSNNCSGGVCQCLDQLSPCLNTSDCCPCLPDGEAYCHPHDSLCRCMPM